MVINTARLLIREFVVEDWRDVLAYQRDPRYLCFYAWSSRTERQVRDFVQAFVDQQVERPRREFQLAISHPHGGPLIGSCGIGRKPDNDWEADIG